MALDCLKLLEKRYQIHRHVIASIAFIRNTFGFLDSKYVECKIIYKYKRTTIEFDLWPNTKGQSLVSTSIGHFWSLKPARLHNSMLLSTLISRLSHPFSQKPSLVLIGRWRRWGPRCDCPRLNMSVVRCQFPPQIGAYVNIQREPTASESQNLPDKGWDRPLWHACTLCDSMKFH